SRLEREHRGKHVRVFAGAHHNGVEVAGPVEHFAEVGELLRARMEHRRLLDGIRVDVAEHGDVFRGDAGGIGDAAAAGADDGDVQFVVEVSPAQQGRHPGGGSCRGQRAAHELAPSDVPTGLLLHPSPSLFDPGASPPRTRHAIPPRRTVRAVGGPGPLAGSRSAPASAQASARRARLWRACALTANGFGRTNFSVRASGGPSKLGPYAAASGILNVARTYSAFARASA